MDKPEKIDHLMEVVSELTPKKVASTFDDVTEYLSCSASTVKRNYKDWSLPHKKCEKFVYFKPFSWDDIGGDVFDPKGLLKKHRMRQILRN